MVLKSLDMAAPLQRTLEMARHHAHAGNLGIMAVLAVSGSVIVLLSLAERKLGAGRKKAGPTKGCGVKAILPAPALAAAAGDESPEEFSEPRAVEECRPAEKDVYESVTVAEEAAGDSNEKENPTPPKKCKPVLKPAQSGGASRTRPKATPPPTKPTHVTPAEKAVVVVETTKGEGRRDEEPPEELASLSDWNQASEDKSSSSLVPEAPAPCQQKAMNPSTCLLFVGSFRTKGNQQAQAVCLDPSSGNQDTCPYCSSPLSSAFDSAAKRKPPCRTQQLQSNIRSLGLRTMAKRIGPDPKTRDSSSETRRFVH